MAKYIAQVKFNPGWGSEKTVHLGSGLTIIAGTNGTGKTKLLQFIHSNNGNNNLIMDDESSTTTINSFSPQRNAAKLLAVQAVNAIRPDANVTESALSVVRSAISDGNYQTIRSISEYFVISAQQIVDADKAKRSESTQQVKGIFGNAIKKLFDFEIKFDYNAEAKTYELFFGKNGVDLTPQQLSQGENSMIALMCALIFGKDSANTILIDEPETHLNWSLEEKLFKFFDEFCTEYQKQIITVTHSRVVFLDEYSSKRLFFEKQGQDISISDKPSEELTRQLAGDSVQLLQGITTKKKLVYVEDSSHRAILSAICQKLHLDVEIIEAGNCEKVKALSRAFKDRQVKNVYFLIDGDNKPVTTEEKRELHENTIQLQKYCIENYLLDTQILQLYRNHDWESQLKSSINNIQVRSNPAIKPVQIALEKGTAVVDIIDFIDGSEVFKKLATDESKKDKRYDFMSELVNLIPESDFFTTYFTELHFLKS